jgi:pantoate--beta-alanine ligase
MTHTRTAHSPTALSPQVVADPVELRQLLDAHRAAGRTIGFVPTMGALHEGHLSLVDASRRDCGCTVVSIYVNPAQFAPGEDFDRYPRPLDADVDLLAQRSVDIVFTPSNHSMYAARHATWVEVEGPALPLEGRFRPGHFRGVATVVLKLFNLVRPDRAYFGRKDYQQSLVVRRMVVDLDLPIHIEVCPTVRDADGLAMSSRNRYLSAEERRRALAIPASLQLARQLADERATDVAAIVARMTSMLEDAQLQIEYVAIVDRDTLEPANTLTGPALAAVAARVGTTRLIDNELLGPDSLKK